MGFPSEALEHAGASDDFVCKVCAQLVDYNESVLYTACTHGAWARAGCSQRVRVAFARERARAQRRHWSVTGSPGRFRR